MSTNKTSQLAIHAVLDGYEECIDLLFESITTTAATTLPASLARQNPKLEQISARLIAQDAALAQALDEVHQHARNSVELKRLLAECDTLDTQLYATMTSMQRAHRDLLNSTKQSRCETHLLHDAVPVDVLLEYSNRIARHTPGLNGFHEDASLSSLAHKNALKSPWPTEDMMRRGALAMDAINMLKPSDKRPRWLANEGESQGDSVQQDRELENGAVKHDPTTRPTYDASEGGHKSLQDTLPAASSVVALDLDLFDPDEED